MADTGLIDITGEGELLLPGAVLINDLQWYLSVDTPNVDYRSNGRPRRVMHVGWIATASGIVGVDSVDIDFADLTITSLHYLQTESDGYHLPSGFPYDERIIWSLGLGITCVFRAFW